MPTSAADLRLAISCVDLTTLEGSDTPDRVRALCGDALRPDPGDPSVGPTAAVCIYPALVDVAVEALAGSSVVVASVSAGFPAGLTPLDARLLEIRGALAAGAQEIDVVVNRSLVLSGRLDEAATELAAMREAAGDAVLKVILETGELADSGLIRETTDAAIAAGADFIKTSTGKTSPAATPEAVEAIAGRVAAAHTATGAVVGVKVSGGVRTSDDAGRYLDLVCEHAGEDWMTPRLFRFGASKLLAALVDDLRRAEGR
ncbi:MAG: deoxyribose-phosphate aldolase [Actinomycetota bacterium]